MHFLCTALYSGVLLFLVDVGTQTPLTRQLKQQTILVVLEVGVPDDDNSMFMFQTGILMWQKDNKRALSYPSYMETHPLNNTSPSSHSYFTNEWPAT